MRIGESERAVCVASGCGLPRVEEEEQGNSDSQIPRAQENHQGTSLLIAQGNISTCLCRATGQKRTAGNGPAPVPPAKTLRLSKNRAARPGKRLRPGSTPGVTAELRGPQTTLSLFGGLSQAIARALGK